MALRFLLRFGASAAVRSARGHRLPAGQIWLLLSAPHHRFADPGIVAGFLPAAVQGRHHCTTPSNPRAKAELDEAVRNIERRLDALEEERAKAELDEAVRKIERRLDALEEERDHGHKRFIKEIFNKYTLHVKEKLGSSALRRKAGVVAKVAMTFGYSAAWGVILYKFCS